MSNNKDCRVGQLTNVIVTMPTSVVKLAEMAMEKMLVVLFVCKAGKKSYVLHF